MIKFTQWLNEEISKNEIKDKAIDFSRKIANNVSKDFKPAQPFMSSDAKGWFFEFELPNSDYRLGVDVLFNGDLNNIGLYNMGNDKLGKDFKDLSKKLQDALLKLSPKFKNYKVSDNEEKHEYNAPQNDKVSCV